MKQGCKFKMTNTTLKYRNDIDGLRAIAVAAVIIFHLGFQSLEGGFVGVDIFFVISGFLITRIIERQIERETFSLGRFYYRRMRRLLPAMLVTVILTFIGAALFLSPSDLIGFAKTAIGAVFSVSNFVFFAQAGYWDGASELKPLLHTWSLGVEEQFYLIWPALLIVAHKFVSRKNVWMVYAGLTLAGCIISQSWVERSPSAAFFLPFFRIFEFAIGALTAHFAYSSVWQNKAIKNAYQRDAVFLVGLGLIVYSILTFTGETPFPGYNALIPCIGSVMILASGASPAGQGAIGTLLLTNPASIWLGRVSYSAYLVHWPIVAFYRYETHQEPTLLVQIAMGVLTLLLAALLHYFVEKKFWIKSAEADTKTQRLSAPKFLTALAGTSLLVAFVSAHAVTQSGWTWRVPDLLLTPEEIKTGIGKRFDRTRVGCRIDQFPEGRNCTSDANVNILVLGNSHEVDAYNFIAAGYEDRDGIQLVSFGTTNSCKDLTFSDGVWTVSGGTCLDRVAAISDPGIVQQFDYIIYGANRPFSGNKGNLLSIIESLKSIKPALKTIIYGGYITNSVDCARLINESGTADSCKDEDNVNYFEDDPSQEHYFDRAMALSDHYIDRVDFLCKGRELASCIVETPERAPIMYDGHHASLEFSEWSGRLYAIDHPNLLDKPK